MVDGECLHRWGSWSAKRRGVQWLLLRSMRATLAAAMPVIDGIAAPPADRLELEVTRARVAAALREADRIEAALASSAPIDTSDDPAAVAAAVALAEQIALDRFGFKTRAPKK